MTVHQIKPIDGDVFALLPQLPKPTGLTSNAENQSPYFTESKQTINGVVYASFSELTATGTEYAVNVQIPVNQTKLVGSILHSIKAPTPATVSQALHLLDKSASPSAGIPITTAKFGSERWVLAGGAPATAQEGWFLFRSLNNGNHWSLIGHTTWSASAPTFPNSVGNPTMLFWNASDGVIVQPSFASPALLVYWTRNGGQSWQETTVRYGQPGNVFTTPKVTREANGQLVITATLNSKATMTFTSQDGGSHWSTASK